MLIGQEQLVVVHSGEVTEDELLACTVDELHLRIEFVADAESIVEALIAKKFDLLFAVGKQFR